MNTGRKLGFANLNQIKPSDEDHKIPDEKIDEIAEAHGFVSREPVQKLTRRKAAAEPSANLNIRPPVSTFNRFLRFCEENRMSYPEALKELMDRAGV